MIKTQVQIPDDPYRETKRVAADYEMSFAEVVRRSLELRLPGSPSRPPPAPCRLENVCAVLAVEKTRIRNRNSQIQVISSLSPPRPGTSVGRTN